MLGDFPTEQEAIQYAMRVTGITEVTHFALGGKSRIQLPEGRYADCWIDIDEISKPIDIDLTACKTADDVDRKALFWLS
jgi:hypothetical protein